MLNKQFHHNFDEMRGILSILLYTIDRDIQMVTRDFSGFWHQTGKVAAYYSAGARLTS